MPEELEKRIAALERETEWLRAAASGGTPLVGQRTPPVLPGEQSQPEGDPSRAEAGSQRHSATRAERAEQMAQQQAFNDYARSPAAQEITRLSQELAALKEWKSQLQGRGGIVVTGTIIELRQNAGATGGGSGTALGPIVLTLSKNGIPTDYNINAEEA